MKHTFSLTVFLVIILFNPGFSHGGVIYEFVETDSGLVRGEMTIKSDYASDASNWSFTGDTLSELLEGGISGFKWAFSSGGALEAASSGDLDLMYPLISNNGSELDAGLFGPGWVEFGTSHVVDSLEMSEFWDDEVLQRIGISFPVAIQGDWVVQSPSTIPLPPTLWLFGSGLIGLIGLVRRKAHD